MRKKLIRVVAVLLMGLATVGTFSACSDNDVPQTPQHSYTDDHEIKAYDDILFGDGTQIGNGDNEVVFKGKQTLKKGTYTLKGWVYVTDRAELTIEPGTIIKGDKETKAAIIVERGGKLHAQGTANAPIIRRH